MAKVVVTKSKLDSLAQHINAKAGTTGAKTIAQMQATVDGISGGGAKETWVLNSAADHPGSAQDVVIFNVDFTSNGLSFSSIVLSTNLRAQISYDSTTVKMLGRWASEAYRKLTFDAPPTGELLTWLQANGVKQPDDTAVQDTKALTITSNGTVSITPDAPYDALKKVDVTVDVASEGGGGETTQLRVETAADNVGSALFCLWQTSNGWTGTSNFDSQTNFTIPNVIVGGYVIITREPTATSQFLTHIYTGVEDIGVGAMDAENDLPEAALVMKITAPSPKVTLSLKS